jgi:hypothetical protein
MGSALRSPEKGVNFIFSFYGIPTAMRSPPHGASFSTFCPNDEPWQNLIE